jgi:putative ABC transport system permease protein
MFSHGSASSLALDVRHAVRGLLRHPTYLLSSVLTLAFGIGAVVAMFSIVYSVLLKPLPYPDPEGLVRIRHNAVARGTELFAASTMYFTYREENRSFAQLGLWQQGAQNLTGTDSPEQLRAVSVTEGTLQALGVQPLRGRWFTADEHEPGTVDSEPVILSHRFWQRRFGAGEPLALEFELDSTRVRVVGVMPPEFRFLDMEPQPDVIRALRLDPARLVIGAFSSQALARLKPGVTPAEAAADLERALPVWLAAWPFAPGSALSREDIEGWRLAPQVIPLKADLTKSIAATLWMFTSLIGLVLLIACANATNLMLLRAAARRQEFSMRTALGAARQRIARCLLIEGGAIGVSAGVLGLIFAQLGVAGVVALRPQFVPRLGEVALHPPVLAIAVGATLFSILAVVSIAVLKSTETRKLSITSSRGSTTARDDGLTRDSLVVVQVALVLALLVSAALMGRSLQALLAVEPGFSQPETVQTVRTSISPGLIAETDQFVVVQREILERIAAIPGVQAAAIASAVPMDGRFNAAPLAVDAAVSPLDDAAYSHRLKWVSPGYFAAMGTRLVAGRDISWADIDNGGRVAVISERLARLLATDAAGAIGQRIKVTSDTDAWREIVGVAEDVYEDGLYAQPPTAVYWPMRMESFFNRPVSGERDMTYAVRSDRAGTAALIDEIRASIRSVNSNIPVFTERTLRDFYADSLARASFTAVMLSIASVLALSLGIVGIYGVMTHVVSRRIREIGIRAALGAKPRQLARLFLVHGLKISGVGVAVGLVMTAALGRLMSSLLFGIEPIDAWAYGVAIGVIVVAAVLASYFPARRAAAIDPVETLRAE